MKSTKSRSDQLRINAVIMLVAAAAWLLLFGDPLGLLFVLGAAIAFWRSRYLKSKESGLEANAGRPSGTSEASASDLFDQSALDT